MLQALDNPAVRALSDLGVDHGTVRAEVGRLRADGLSAS
jgi:hypothetical protein